MTLPSTTELLEQQEANYQTVISACNEVLNCRGVTLWDFTDKVRTRLTLAWSLVLTTI